MNFTLNESRIVEKIKTYDTIIPVPISTKIKMQRGYNQSFLIAKKIAKSLNLEIINNCLYKDKNIIEQSKLNKEDRQKNIQGVYKLINKEKLKNKKILLIDDIYTTGSTVNECSRTLRQAEIKEIGVFTIAKD